MAQHLQKGFEAERLAGDWLISKGYCLIASNFRYRHAEIDLILTHNGILVFVEVKFRSGLNFGHPEEFVDYRKKQLIIRAADHFIHLKDWHWDIRFDIVSVSKDPDGNFTYYHFEDAFY
ncbi:YraN family protein [Litoribacter ruber]|uniref:YraN family protein n=1 Tax=Litoribacter ruber TaxID=702568 RepID=UPI001BD9FB6A|nr:YraN family protein [Litoribacter ruber]MBT0811040.1 YraN family protein [Litoribacter ruber]